MSAARTLYLILNIIIFLLLMGIGLGIFFFIMLLFGENQSFLRVDEDIDSFRNETLFYFYLVLRIGVFVCFIISIWKLRKATKWLIKRDFYSDELIKALSTSGKFMVYTGVSSWCIDGLSNLFFKYRISFGLSEKTLVYLFVIGVGLLLMLMTTVLREAKAVKQENDLTI